MNLRSTLIAGALALALIGHSLASDKTLTENVQTDPVKAELVFTDVERFVSLTKKLSEVSDTMALLASEYLEPGSPGLKMFIQKYGLTPERLIKAMRKHPEKYTAMDKTLAALEASEPTFRLAYAKMKEIMPDAVFPPTYFLVAGHRGIGSGSTEGPLFSVEKEVVDEGFAEGIAGTLVHEMTHMQQLALTGEDYFVIFSGAENTLLARSIREGVATYFTEIIWGGSRHKNEAQEFLGKHESELWARFQQDMHKTEFGDWLWSDPENPEQPRDVGYAMGARIARAYYENATDKPRAVREILSVTDYPAFLEKSGYGKNFK